MDGIGNTLMSLPAIKEFKRKSPKTHVTLMVLDNGSFELIKDATYIDKAIKIKKGDGRFIRPIRALRHAKPEVIVFLQPTSIRKSIIGLLSGVKNRICYQEICGKIRNCSYLCNLSLPNTTTKHDIEKNQELVEYLLENKIEISNKSLIEPKKEEINFAKQVLKKNRISKKDTILGIHPGCGRKLAIKEWPIQHFSTLMRLVIKNKKWKILVFLGPDEIEKTKEIPKNKNIVVIKKTTINQTAALINQCNLFLSNDSGLGHMASFLGLPTLVIMGGPGDPKEIRPYFNGKVIFKDLKCQPCQNKIRTIEECKNKRRCLTEIKPDEVYKKLLSMKN